MLEVFFVVARAGEDGMQAVGHIRITDLLRNSYSSKIQSGAADCGEGLCLHFSESLASISVAIMPCKKLAEMCQQNLLHNLLPHAVVYSMNPT